MAITLASKFRSELKKGLNTPNVVIELYLDGGAKRYGFHACAAGTLYLLADGRFFADGSMTASGSVEEPPVIPILKSVSSLQNKLDPKTGYSTRGQLTAVLCGRENFRGLLENEYLKNRRVVRMDGFISAGFTYRDYASTFTGKVQDWSLKGDELTITIADDMKDASVKIPVENTSRTQFLDYRNMNPVDIMTDILQNRAGIASGSIALDRFSSERDLWLSNWKFDRVLTEPKEANEYLNELQAETNSFIVHDGEKVNFKVFSPPTPGQSVEEWSDSRNIIDKSFSVKSGYRDNFYNRVIIYFDYDESGGGKEENYESAVIAADLASQDPSEWDEVKTKVIMSRWIRTCTHNKTSNISGLTVYHVSTANGAGTGTITYSRADGTLRWTAPSGAAGQAVKVSSDGKFQLFDADLRKYVRAVVKLSDLPLSDSSDSVTISGLSGGYYASTLAAKLLNRYRDPAASVSFEIDINDSAFESQFIKPTDLKDITTAEAFKKGGGTWNRQRVMLTSVRPDISTHRVSIEAIETGLYRRYGFIAPSGVPEYPAAQGVQKQYGFIGATPSNKVNVGAEDGFYIW